MRNRTLAILAGCGLALVLASCATTTQYLGPSDFVSYRADEKLRSSSQSAALKAGEKEPLVNTYDQENVYDAKGNLIKVKLTEYIDRLAKDKKFIVWETEYKVIGGNVVPASMSANGVPYLEVEYELLSGSGKGEIASDIMKRPVRASIKFSPFSAPITINRSISLENYTVGFRADGRFVKKTVYYGMNGYYYDDNTLTLGYDNIALKRYSYSQEKLSEGIAKSFTGYNRDSAMFQKMSKDVNVAYDFEWKAAGEAICQTKMSFAEKDFKLEASLEYNAEGKRVKETWFVSDPKNAKKAPRQVFLQELAY